MSAAVPGGTVATSTTRCSSARTSSSAAVDEEYRQITMDPRQVAVWSARNHGANFVDFTGPSQLPAPKVEKDDDDDWSFEPSSVDGDDGKNIDFNAFVACRPRFF
jgi:hypothetical protein